MSEETLTDNPTPSGSYEADREKTSWRDSLVVLETDGPDALVYNPGNKYTPFIVASYFDPERRTWSHGSYFSDLLSASCSLHGLPSPDHTLKGFTPPDIDAAMRDRFIDREVAEMALADLNKMLDNAVKTSKANLVGNGFVEQAVESAEKRYMAELEEPTLESLVEGKTAESEAIDPGNPCGHDLAAR